MQHGQATWICGMSIKREDCDMKHGNAAGTGGCKAWTCTLACRMGLQNENAAWTSSISIFVLFHVHLFIFIFCSFYCSDSMFIRNAHAAWACSVKRSMDIAWRQRNEVSSWSIDLQHCHVRWTCKMNMPDGQAAWTCSMNMKLEQTAWRHRHAARIRSMDL